MADANSTAIPARMQNRKRPLPPLDAMLAEANRIYRYDPTDGNLYWIAATNPKVGMRRKIGEIVGGDDGHGYRMCMLLGHKFKVHQIVWLINHGVFPHMPIDHIDGDRRNNCITNLRLVSDFQNMQNLNAARRDFAGVRKASRGPRYTSRIVYRGKSIYLGSFDTPEQARDAYVKANKELRGEYSPV